MPGGDRTGPMGEGPMTGRGLGRCSGSRAGFFRPARGPGMGIARGFSRGMGFGRGPGRGFGMRFWDRPFQPWPARQYDDLKERKMLEDDRKAIEEEKRYLEQEAEAIKKRLEELDSRQ